MSPDIDKDHSLVCRPRLAGGGATPRQCGMLFIEGNAEELSEADAQVKRQLKYLELEFTSAQDRGIGSLRERSPVCVPVDLCGTLDLPHELDVPAQSYRF